VERLEARHVGTVHLGGDESSTVAALGAPMGMTCAFLQP
jgi:hypothetical protein